MSPLHAVLAILRKLPYHRQMPEIDLHTHSTASDGTYTPTELISAAVHIGLKALALTDHDTVQGVAEARAASHGTGLELIPGCELSVSFSRGSMHLLGLWLPEQPTALLARLEHLSAMRKARNETIVRNLNGCGVNITYDELEQLAQGGSIGRPHIAQLLIEKGAASSLQDAFQNWLRPGTKGYAPKEKLTPEQGIGILKDEGATVILAHPCTLNLNYSEMDVVLRELKDCGLDGLEAHYSMHTQAQTNYYVELCRKFDLLESAGSDFHGGNKPNIRLGRGKGGLRPSYHLLERMKERRVAQGLPVPNL